VFVVEETSPLDNFLFEIVKNQQGKILDYGCGQGRFIEYCGERGLKIYGADTFEGIYQSWDSQSGSILKIQNNVVPAEDKSFEVVITNQVLEHIPPAAIFDVSRELTRLISNNGFGFHIFPTKKTLVEPHVGIVGAHWLKNGSRIQRKYLQTCFKLGFGYWRSNEKRGRYATKTCNEWVNESASALKNHCFFVSFKKWEKAIRRNGLNVENVGYLLVIFLLPKPFKTLLKLLTHYKIARTVLNILVSLRLGSILRVTR
jgi:hypothetical protein